MAGSQVMLQEESNRQAQDSLLNIQTQMSEKPQGHAWLMLEKTIPTNQLTSISSLVIIQFLPHQGSSFFPKQAPYFPTSNTCSYGALWPVCPPLPPSSTAMLHPSQGTSPVAHPLTSS